MSQPGPGDLAAALSRALVDEWARFGVVHAVASPGSRSTPLALALFDDARISLEVILDERSAAFFALGAAKASGRPSVLVCTSGTAAANYFPAVIEAFHAGVPLIVCSADRPPTLRDTGAGQTIDQVKLYGHMVRWSCDLGVPAVGEATANFWRQSAARACITATGRPPGPVHLNVGFDEPLVASGPRLDYRGRDGAEPWLQSLEVTPHLEDRRLDALVERVDRAKRPLLVAGWGAKATSAAAQAFAKASSTPVLADTISGLREGEVVTSYEGLVRVGSFCEAHVPDLVIQLGAPLTSKLATAFVQRSPERVLVAPDGFFLDPARSATHHVVAEADWLLGRLTERVAKKQPDWYEEWMSAEARARNATAQLFASWTEPFEGRIARDVFAALPNDSTFYVASSMPVRDLEYFAQPRGGVHVLANRGVNGIDGFVSSALGAAAADPTVALCGDLCFLHDAGGLLGAARRGGDCTFVVIDNDGGGIFSFLDQSRLDDERFERLFGTPQGLDLESLALLHDLPVQRVDKADDLVPAVQAAAGKGVQVVLVRTDRADNVARHRAVWQAIEAGLSSDRCEGSN